LLLEIANEGLPANMLDLDARHSASVENFQLRCEGFIIFARFDNQSLRTSESDFTLANLRAIVDELRSQGCTGLRTIAGQLNERAILTPRGGVWHSMSAARRLSRLQA
jgi:hypothetical protein